MSNESSELSIYDICVDLTGQDYKEIWDKYVMARTRVAICRDVFSFDGVGAEDLWEWIKSGDSKGRDELFKDLQREVDSGANYVFVQPRIGGPIAGFHL